MSRRSFSRSGRAERTRELDDAASVRFRRCRLSVTVGPDAGRTLDTDRPLLTVGTSSDNDFVLTDEAVSRHHLSVLQRGGEYIIVDEGSTNGTWLDGLRLREVSVARAKEIQLGDTLILFEPLSTDVVVEPSLRGQIGGLVGRSAAMRKIIGAIEKVADTDLPVLVEGETGTGKSLVAEALHLASGRGGRLVYFDCAALPSPMSQHALLGTAESAGALSEASDGTLVLERIDATSDALRAELLGVLEQGRLPNGEELAARVVCTSMDLGAATDEGRFPPDLFYRLAAVRLSLPPLRERPEDLPDLVAACIERQPELGGRRLEKSAWSALERHPFPGNVRELFNAIVGAAAGVETGPLTARDLGLSLGARDARPTPEALELPDATMPFKDAKARVVDAFERRYLVDLLARNGQNISGAAREAGIDRRHLYRLLEKYGLDEKEG